MGKEYVYLSFFKSNKVDYIFHKQSKIIEFPCIHCNDSAKICTKTARWDCKHCNRNGNFLTLIEYSKENSFGEIFIPKQELKLILQMLKRLNQKYPSETNFLSLKGKIINLVDYYEKNTV